MIDQSDEILSPLIKIQRTYDPRGPLPRPTVNTPTDLALHGARSHTFIRYVNMSSSRQTRGPSHLGFVGVVPVPSLQGSFSSFMTWSDLI